MRRAAGRAGLALLVCATSTFVLLLPSSRSHAQATAHEIERSPGSIRVVTWNIGANSVAGPAGARVDIEAASRPAAFARVMRALAPDIVCLQELTIGPERAAALFDRIQPLSAGQRWNAVSVLGNVLLSRFPLSDRHARVLHHRLSTRGHVNARVHLPDSIGVGELTVTCTHLQAKGGTENAAFRQRHASIIAADLHDVHGPIIILGDLNAIDDPAPYLRTLQIGQPEGRMSPTTATTRRDIIAAQRNGFPLRLSHALHNGVGPDTYTWRNDQSGFAPGVLDYILFSERGFVPRVQFVLNTMTLPQQELSTLRLRSTDVIRNPAARDYDHLPVVVDLAYLRLP